jgi:hypothetical protein
MKKGRRIKTLHQLAEAATERRAVVLGPYLRQRFPAATIMCRQARDVLRMIDDGMWIYVGKRRVDLSKPPRTWCGPSRPTPQINHPVLNLPYYPEL